MGLVGEKIGIGTGEGWRLSMRLRLGRKEDRGEVESCRREMGLRVGGRPSRLVRKSRAGKLGLDSRLSG